MDSSTAAKALSAVQNFVQTNIPSQLGLEIVLGKGTSSGTVSFELSGGWYGQPQDLDSVLAPLLRQLPSGPWKSIKKGSYIESVTTLAGGSLNTQPPERRDTFYAKSLMTPESSPITDAALSAFVRYLAGTGFSSNTLELTRMKFVKEWFVGIGVYGGKNSAINAVSPDATAFPHRRSLFGIQFYASSPGSKPPFPQAGFNFVDVLQTGPMGN
ncbi:hypothetical protein H0H93_007378 [Arthromyces matolae]|nr:hypothetical protein H0H93_007378 [Arthromyces matolae]